MPDYTKPLQPLQENYEPPKKIGRPPGSKNKKKGAKKLPRDKAGIPISKPKELAEVTWRCCCCGTEYPRLEGNFVTSNSELFRGWGGYAPFCRLCVARYYNDVALPAFDGTEAKAVEHMCGLLDWYYDDELIDMANKLTETFSKRNKSGETNVPMIITYGTRKNMTQFARRGTTFLDNLVKRWKDSLVVRTADDVVNLELNVPKGLEVNEDDVWFFGSGYTPMQYKYLREQYDDWCDRYDCQSKAQEEIFKSIVIAQLNVQKAQLDGDQKRWTDATKTLQDLMNTAKIQPKQRDDSALVEQNTFGTLIKRWEEEKPIPEPAEEWRDVDNIKHYIGAYFLGHLSKMFKLDNEWSDIYEEEIRKHTVQPPRYEETETGDDGAFDAMYKAMRKAAVEDRAVSSEE